MQNTYYQTFDGGSFSFTNTITAQNGLNPGASGNGLASMLLGFGSSGSETAFSVPWESLHYQGYYAQDTWQATNKLTVTAGVRWEIPGVWTERYNRIASFNPHEVNPALQALGITLNGQPIWAPSISRTTTQHPEKGMMKEHFGLVCSPAGHCLPPGRQDRDPSRRGHLLSPVQQLISATRHGDRRINQYGTSWLSTLDGGVTPYYSISNPFPNGFNSTPGNLPHAQAQAALIGGSLGGMSLGHLRYPYQSSGISPCSASYRAARPSRPPTRGRRGVHLPTSGLTSDALPPQDLSMG